VSDDRYGDRTVLVADDVTATLEADSFENDAFEGTVARIPLAYGDTVYGTLSVATERPAAFGDDERAWLATIGRQVGYAIAAIRRRNLLLSDRVTELEVVCRDDRSFFVDVSRRLDCRFELDSLVPIDESTQLYYVRLEDASPADVFDLADDEPGIEDCRLVETDEEGWRIEVVVDGSCPIVTLTEYGVTVHEAVFEGGTATITGDCAVDADLRTIVDGLRSAFPDSELVGKRETERAVQTAREFREGLEDRLTDRQEAALRAAYFGGYYDWPRRARPRKSRTRWASPRRRCTTTCGRANTSCFGRSSTTRASSHGVARDRHLIRWGLRLCRGAILSPHENVV